MLGTSSCRPAMISDQTFCLSSSPTFPDTSATGLECVSSVEQNKLELSPDSRLKLIVLPESSVSLSSQGDSTDECPCPLLGRP